jgi:carbamate kinase
MNTTDKLDVIALGGNAILPAGKTGTIAEQVAITWTAMAEIEGICAAGRRVVLTHGNGPIVGNIVVRNEAMKSSIPPMPLDVCGADSQGGIGYMIQQTLRNVLRERGRETEVVSVVTQVLVDEHDPAFQDPVKPIGPYYRREKAESICAKRGWKMAPGQRGYRRVVPSPYPKRIVEIEVIRSLVRSGVIVVTVGGGGIPVVLEDGRYRGVEAVIDKDLASSLLARELGAERLIIITNVDAVYTDFGKPGASRLANATLAEMKELLGGGHFPPGSMGSKIQAAVEFLDAGGLSAIITQPGSLVDAVAGRAGTTIRRD